MARACRKCRTMFDPTLRQIRRGDYLCRTCSRTDKREWARAQKKKRTRKPEVRRAHTAVWNELRQRRIKKQPCAVCGAARVDSHHEDYSKPLEIIWLCRAHHQQRHVELAAMKAK